MSFSAVVENFMALYFSNARQPIQFFSSEYLIKRHFKSWGRFEQLLWLHNCDRLRFQLPFLWWHLKPFAFKFAYKWAENRENNGENFRSLGDIAVKSCNDIILKLLFDKTSKIECKNSVKHSFNKTVIFIKIYNI